MLCHMCQSLDLNLPDSDELLLSEYNDDPVLDNLASVLGRENCPSCRLILHLVYDQVRVDSGSADGREYREQGSNIECAVRRNKNVYEVLNQFGLQGYICNARRVDLPDKALDDLEYVGSSFGRQLKITLLREWIQDCETQHRECKIAHSTTYDGERIRLSLIDVRNNCLVEGTSAERYVALSYVWGAVQTLRTTKENREELHAAGALLKRKREIPRAIRDAITLVSLLNERFLWVDSLCIVQDDEANKHEQIQQMNVVYGHAFLTIIALSGHDANCPLPGVAFHSRPELFAVADIGSGRLISRPLKFEHLLQNSVYEARAWTYQERLLSRSCLVLTTHQAYYHCWTGLRSDISQLSEKDNTQIGVSLNPLIDDPQPSSSAQFLWYNDLVRAYSIRDLSFQSDKLNAFAGIEAILRVRLNSNFIYGLPEKLFDLALHWISTESLGKSPVITAATEAAFRNRDFPSWTWAGHVGQVSYLDGPLKALKRGPTMSTVISEVECLGIVVNNAYQTLDEQNNDRLQVRFKSHVSPYNTASVSDLPFNNGTLGLRACCSTLECFSIERVEWESSLWILYDSARKCCGRVWPDSPEFAIDAEGSKWEMYELVLLSFSDVIDVQDPLYLGYHFDLDRFPITRRCMANTLLVQSKDSRSERVALIQIHAIAWEGAEQAEKVIYLS